MIRLGGMVGRMLGFFVVDEFFACWVWAGHRITKEVEIASPNAILLHLLSTN